MGLFDGLLDETPTTSVDTSPLPSNDSMGSLLPKLLMAGGLMGSAMSGNDQTAKILPLFLRQQAAEALQERQRSQRAGSIEDFRKIEGALTQAYQESGGDSSKAAGLFSQSIRTMGITDPQAMKVGMLAIDKLREKGRADAQELAYQKAENAVDSSVPADGFIAPGVMLGRLTQAGVPLDRAMKRVDAYQKNITRNNQNGTEQASAINNEGRLVSQYGGSTVNMPTEKLGGSVVSRGPDGTPTVAPLQGSSPVLVPDQGKGIGILTQGAEGGPSITDTVQTPQKVENTNDLINAAAFHKVDLRQLEQDMNSPDPRTQARAMADRQILGTHALAEKMFTPEVVRIAAQTPGLLKKLYDRATNDLLGQTGAPGNPAADVSKGIQNEKATTAGAMQWAENPALIARHNQETANTRGLIAQENAGKPYSGTQVHIDRETFLAPDVTPTVADTATPDFRKRYATVSQAKGLMVDRANRALASADGVLAQATEMATNLPKGAVYKLKEWAGTGPAKAYQTGVVDLVTEINPALTGSVRSIGSQFEAQMKVAPSLKDQMDVTKVYVNQIKAVLNNARRSAIGLATMPIPTYNEIMNTYTTNSGVKATIEMDRNK